MFRDVPECSGMFRNVPCSRFYRRPLKLWKTASGLDLDDSFVDLPVSSHYWKPTTLSVSLLEGVKIVGSVSKGEYNGELEIDMSSLTQNKTYTMALEYQVPKRCMVV